MKTMVNGCATVTVEIILKLLALVATVQAAPNNCSAQYLAALKQVVNLKETCSEAVQA